MKSPHAIGLPPGSPQSLSNSLEDVLLVGLTFSTKFNLCTRKYLDTQSIAKAREPTFNNTKRPLHDVPRQDVCRVVSLLCGRNRCRYWSQQVRLWRVSGIAEQVPATKLAGLEARAESAVGENRGVMRRSVPSRYDVAELQIWRRDGLDVQRKVPFSVPEEFRVISARRLHWDMRAVNGSDNSWKLSNVVEATHDLGLLRTRTGTANDICGEPGDGLRHPSDHNAAGCLADAVQVPYIHLHVYTHAHYNLPDKASPGETGSASRVTQTEIVYKVTHLYNVFPIAAWSSLMTMHWLFSHQVYSKRWSLFQWKNVASIQYALYFYSVSTDGLSSGCVSIIQKTSVDQLKKSHE